MNRFAVASLTLGLFMSGLYAEGAEKLYWRETTQATGTTIKRSNLDGTSVETIVVLAAEVTNSFGLAHDAAAGKLFWCEGQAGLIRRASLDGTNPETVLSGLAWPWYIALDPTGGKIYWVQDDGTGSTQGVYRANFDGSGQEQLLATRLFGIDLDLPVGKLYGGGGGGTGPVRCNLDGSESEALIPAPTFWSTFGESVFTSDVKLDLQAGKVYFTFHPLATGASALGRCNLDGSAPERLIFNSSADPDPAVALPLGLALDLAHQHMYWSNFGRHRITRANLDGTGPVHVLESTVNPTSLLITQSIAIPVLSEWGITVGVLLVIAAGTAVVRSRAATRTA